MGIMFIVSFLLLLLLTAIIWKSDGSAGILNGGIVFIYAAVNLLGGLMTGKMMGKQKFFWGLVAGGIYFLVLAAVGVALGGTKLTGNPQLISGAFICMISGMLGGMLAPGQAKG